MTDAEEDPRFFSGVDRKLGLQTKTYLCVPLVSDGKGGPGGNGTPST